MNLRINSPTVIHETLDDEVVIVHFESGAYYNLRQTGAEIWNMIDAGRSSRDIIAFYQHHYKDNGADIERAVLDFLAHLRREDLVIPTDVPDSATNEPESVAAGDILPASEFITPCVEKYSDMQDLLLLDPIHEVDAGGWPHRQAEEDDGKTE
jgi:hypothetical protein